MTDPRPFSRRFPEAAKPSPRAPRESLCEAVYRALILARKAIDAERKATDDLNGFC